MSERLSQGNGLSRYRALAEFRHQIRRFVRFSEEAARKHGLEPQQHQLLLAIKGLPAGCSPTVGHLAERLVLEHHSTVELISRLEKLGAVAKNRSEQDRREVLVELTPLGEDLLARLTRFHEMELETAGPHLIASLESVLEDVSIGGEGLGPAKTATDHQQTVSEAFPKRKL